VFIAVKPELISLLTFGHAGVVGSVLRIGAEVALGAVGGVIGATQDRIRVPTVIAVTVVISLGLLRRIVHPALAQLGLRDDWLFSVVTLGLTWFGAAAVFVVTFVTTFAWRANSAAIVARTHRTPATERGVRVVVLAVIGAGLIALPFLIGSIFSQILGTVGIYILLGLGLNIVVGYAGLLDLGYVAFFAVGAYTTAILTGGSRVTTTGYAPPSFSLHLSFFVAIPIVVVVAALVGLVIGAPVLRLRGDYLAIVTLGFGEIARVLFSSDWLKGAFGGTQGITAIPAAPIGNLDFRDTQHFYFLVLGFCLIAVYVSWRLADSRVGRAWNAMREDEQVAEAVGVSTVRYKLLAFAMGGAIGSLGGALFAVRRCAEQRELHAPRIDHRACCRDPGRHGKHPGRHRRGPRADRDPGGVLGVRAVPAAAVRGRLDGDHDPAPARFDPERPAVPGAGGGGRRPGQVGRVRDDGGACRTSRLDPRRGRGMNLLDVRGSRSTSAVSTR
jgi:branched-chain amino acid transport system permease protein